MSASNNRASMIESLESRLFLAAHSPIAAPAPLATTPAVVARPRATAAVNLFNLLGYNRVGSTFNYNTTLAINSPIFSENPTGPSTTTITQRATRIPSRPLTIVTASFQRDTLTTALSNSRTGTSLSSATFTNADYGTLNVRFRGLRLFPASLSIGQTVSDTGTFSGNATVTSDNINGTGSFSGAVTSTTRLTGTQQVTVPAGTFTATRGVSTLRLNGTIRVRGQSVPFTATLRQTFLAVPDVGIVKNDLAASARARIPVVGTQSATLTTSSDLTSVT